MQLILNDIPHHVLACDYHYNHDASQLVWLLLVIIAHVTYHLDVFCASKTGCITRNFREEKLRVF